MVIAEIDASAQKVNALAAQSQACLHNFLHVRRQTLALVAPLSPEDMVVQSMPDASPTKWHLAHTSWFFEAFILKLFKADFCWFNTAYNHLFNSYYESVGPRHARPYRGMLTRPSLEEVKQYRTYIDDAVQTLVRTVQCETQLQQIMALMTLGIHHEMQHQELISTDILHLLWHNPLRPTIYPCNSSNTQTTSNLTPLRMIDFDGGIVSVGQNLNTDNFSYDCEGPAHNTLLQPYRLSNRLITNEEWLAFIADGGYSNSLLWLSDGWAAVQKHQWQAPLYWLELDGAWQQYGLDGLQPLLNSAPVCHVSYYEADAFARWAGKRLPLEHEWEVAAQRQAIEGNFLENNAFRPQPSDSKVMAQLFGDVWQWTQSPFSPYPGFNAQAGALGEYNGKFMNNQYVLRGGSCVTPKQQLRTSYRNFFYPHHRWQFSGLRLAEYQ